MSPEHPNQESNIERWRNQARQQLKAEQEARRIHKTRVVPLDRPDTTGPILRTQTKPEYRTDPSVTPWFGISDIADAPTLHGIEAIKKPVMSSVSMKSMHDSDIPPEQEMVYVSGSKWHFDSPAHMPDRATLKSVIERYRLNFHQCPTKLEVSEGFFANLCIFNLLEMQEDRAMYRYNDCQVQIVTNFWSPFWCVASPIPHR